MDVRELLEGVKNGSLSVEEAEIQLKKAPYEDIDFARLDNHRSVRTGFPEVIFCQSKPDDYLVAIYKKMYENHGQVLAPGPAVISISW